jgi:hypothetical protein
MIIMNMKRIFLLSALLAVSSFSSSHGKPAYYGLSGGGQDLEKFKFGVRGGFHLCMFLCNEAFEKGLRPDFSQDAKFGLRGDIYGEYALTDTVGVHLTLMYSQKGTRYIWSRPNSLMDTPKIHMDVNFHYISLSPSLRMYPGHDRQFCIFLGPYFSYLLSAKSQFYRNNEAKGDPSDWLDKNMPEEKRPKRFDIGGVLGIDYEFDSGVLLGGYLAADFGITNLCKKREGMSEETQQPQYRNFSLLHAWIGYNFAKLFY